MKVPKNFKCKRCGDCCFSPRISKEEIKKIEKRYKLKGKDFAEKLRKGFYYIKQKRGKCMFLKRGKKTRCMIYPLRPKVCRLYPSKLDEKGGCKPKKLYFDYYLERMRRLPRLF